VKLSKISWLVLIVGIFTISFAGLGTAHSQQLDEQDQLDEELSLAEIRISNFQIDQLSAQRVELEKQLNQATLQLEAAKDDLRQRIESIGVTDSFFEIAEDCNVEIIEISSSGLSSDELEVPEISPSSYDSDESEVTETNPFSLADDDLEGITCSIQVLTAEVEGDVADLITFIISLNSNFTTGVVVSAVIDIPGATEEDEGTIEEEEEEEEQEEQEEGEEVAKPSADIRMAIYSYEGD